MRRKPPIPHVRDARATKEAPMAIKVRIPSPLRTYTNGVDVIETEGAKSTINDVLTELKAKVWELKPVCSNPPASSIASSIFTSTMKTSASWRISTPR